MVPGQGTEQTAGVDRAAAEAGACECQAFAAYRGTWAACAGIRTAGAGLADPEQNADRTGVGVVDVAAGPHFVEWAAAARAWPASDAV